MPVATDLKRSLYRSRGACLLSWGWWLVQPQRAVCAKWTMRIKKGVCWINTMASRALWILLEGHWTDPWFESGHQAVKAFIRAAYYWRKQGIIISSGTWHLRVQQFLSHFGIQQIGPLAWTSGGLRFDFNHHDYEVILLQLGHLCHQVRDVFRKMLFDQFLARQRRDSRFLSANCRFNAERAIAARKFHDTGTAHMRAVLLGAALSPAVYDVLRHRPAAQRCPSCLENVVPDWEHVVWVCSFFSRSRPPECHDLLQRRLGWPSFCNDISNLQHMAAVRETCHDRCGFHGRANAV